VKLISKGPSRY